MSPELFDPERFGLEHSRRTKSSDCYAVGMVIYEVLSGHVPFPQYGSHAVVFKVLRGERPEKPQGVRGNWFTGDVWRILEGCWRHEPGGRPGIPIVLYRWTRLDEFWGLWEPSPLTAAEGPQSVDSSTWSLSRLITSESVTSEVVPSD